jgi:UDPglucose 6-dehydrogenase
MKPDRVVIGTDDPRVAEIMKELYAPFVRTGHPVIVMDPASAELTKYAANAMLATRISFMNEVARICDLVGADINRVREGIGSDERIGYPFLFAGIGYGGSCFPKDVKAIVRTSEEKGYSFAILKAVEDVNERQKSYLLDKVLGHFGPDLKGRHFAMWGLSFKPRTDDMREAPSLVLIEKLLAKGARVTATDPEAIDEARKHVGDRVRYTKIAMDALDGVDGLLLVTEWNEFRQPDFDEMKKRMKAPVVFDGRNIFPGKKLQRMGFTYYGVGVPG